MGLPFPEWQDERGAPDPADRLNRRKTSTASLPRGPMLPRVLHASKTAAPVGAVAVNRRAGDNVRSSARAVIARRAAVFLKPWPLLWSLKVRCRQAFGMKRLRGRCNRCAIQHFDRLSMVSGTGFLREQEAGSIWSAP